MPTNNPSEMSNEELVDSTVVEFADAFDHKNGDTVSIVHKAQWEEYRAELLRRLNRAEGLEARLISEIDDAGTEWANTLTKDAVKRIIHATFAAIREEG